MRIQKSRLLILEILVRVSGRFLHNIAYTLDLYAEMPIANFEVLKGGSWDASYMLLYFHWFITCTWKFKWMRSLRVVQIHVRSSIHLHASEACWKGKYLFVNHWGKVMNEKQSETIIVILSTRRRYDPFFSFFRKNYATTLIELQFFHIDISISTLITEKTISAQLTLNFLYLQVYFRKYYSTMSSMWPSTRLKKNIFHKSAISQKLLIPGFMFIGFFLIYIVV